MSLAVLEFIVLAATMEFAKVSMEEPALTPPP